MHNVNNHFFERKKGKLLCAYYVNLIFYASNTTVCGAPMFYIMFVKNCKHLVREC
jgi:hypothetical protein